jgi:hypothetical protein
MTIPGQGRIEHHVKSRLSASLMFSALWIAAETRNNHGQTSTVNPLSGESDSSVAAEAVVGPALDTRGHAFLAPLDTASPQDFGADWSFPWGMWDDCLRRLVPR